MEGKKIIKQGQEIFEGFKYSIFKDEKIEIDAEKRLKICFECPTRTDKRCDTRKGGCGCRIEIKARSPKSQCPQNKW